MSHPSARVEKRTIAVVSGSRADFGLYLSILRAILAAPDLHLRLMVSGAHLSSAYGDTWRCIEAEGIPIAERIEMLSSETDTPEAIATAIAHGVTGFAAAFARDRPDIVLVLGDRYEMLAAAIAALPFALPLAHIHGGELTEGAIDEAIRHALTKMSHLHFVSTEIYRERIVQMGERPECVIVSGAPGLDAIRLISPTPRRKLEQRLGLEFNPAPLLVTFHPVTLEYDDAAAQTRALMTALDKCGRPVLFTYPNADTGARGIIEAVEAFVAAHSRSRVVKHLGSADYFGVMAESAAMVGNSSSGIIEALSFELPVVNIGNRQRGRLRAANVIDCAPEIDAVCAAIEEATSVGFRAGLAGVTNPYGDGRAAERIVYLLRTAPIDASLVEKRFFDLPGLPEILAQIWRTG